MKYAKYLALTLTLVMLCAVSPLNAATDGNLDPDEEIGEAVDIYSFSYLSQVVYEDMILLNYTVNCENAIPKELNSLQEVADFYNAHHIPATLVQTGRENLRMGDIVELDDEECPFLIYIKCENGVMLLEDIDNGYDILVEDFDKGYTGNALLINHTVPTSLKRGHYKATSKSGKKKGLVKKTVNSFWKTGTKGAINTWYGNKRIKNIAQNTLGGRKGTYADRAWRIWCWMREGTYGGRHMYFHCTEHDPLAEWWMGKRMAHWGTIHTVDQTIDAKHGNCVEQARLNVELARAMGCRARYVTIPGHIWAQISSTGGDGASGVWIDMETSRGDMGFKDWKDKGHERERGYHDNYDK